MSHKLVQTDINGNIIHAQIKTADEIPVLSNEIIPKGCDRYEQAYIIDKADVAICDGNDTWYRQTLSGVVSAQAGQPWTALFG